MGKSFSRRSRLLALSAAGVLAVSVGIAYAAIPGANGVISGCYGNSNGQLRVVDAESGQECKNNETALDWSQTGPAGPQGPQGPTGPQGPKGDKGDKGDPGIAEYEVFSLVQDFGPGGIGGAWCGAPNANTQDNGWRVVSGGAQLTSGDINAGVVVASSWPNLGDPNNPGWNIQLNKPANVDPGPVTVYAVCVKVAQ